MLRHFLPFFSLVLVLLFSCHKQEEPIRFVDSYNEFSDRYVITMEDGRVSKVEHFINEQWQSSKIYEYHLDKLFMFTEDSYRGRDTTEYLLDAYGLYTFSYDSLFSEEIHYASSTEYVYDANAYLVESINHFINYDIEFSRVSTNEYLVENGNIVRSCYSSSSTGLAYSCNFYTFSNLPNKVNLDYFRPEEFGKWNANLVSKAIWEVGGRCGTPKTTAFSIYEYELDSAGYVVQRTETRTNCTSPYDVKIDRTISETYYEYIF